MRRFTDPMGASEATDPHRKGSQFDSDAKLRPSAPGAADGHNLHERHQTMSLDTKPMSLSYWAVAFLDLLGFREVLDGMDVFPLPASSPERDRVTASFARAIRLRRRLLGAMDQLMQGHSESDPQDFADFPPPLRAMAESWRQVRLIKVNGADHIVLACSLARGADHFPMRGIHALVFGSAAAMLLQLSMGADDFDDTRPLRGGIDVALGHFMVADDFLYSPALTRAYELESKQAIVPRTLIGDRFLGAMQEQAASSGNPEAEHCAELAQRVLRMIFPDSDGEPALDFMGPEVLQTLDPALARQLVGDAWTYATRALEAARTLGDAKRIRKYEWLVAYMTPRIVGWL